MKIQTTLIASIAIIASSVNAFTPSASASYTKNGNDDSSYICAESDWTIWNTNGSDTGKKLNRGECMQLAKFNGNLGITQYGTQHFVHVISIRGEAKLLKINLSEVKALDKKYGFGGC